ncbi:MAG: ribonuclease T2 [Methyloligellaceae bacterium]
MTPRGRRLACLFLAALCAILPASAGRPDGIPGSFDYYVLTLSWSPSYCAREGAARGEPQCNGTRPYAFVLHGLWPQYQRGWPSHCDTGKRPWVRPALIDAMLDIMPSPRLVIHEYRKHGTCAGLSPERYFALSRELFSRIRIPPRYQRPRTHLLVSPQELEADFLKANPQLDASQIAVACSGNRHLREVRICFSRKHEPTACGENERPDRLCRLDKIVLPPVRGR